MKYDCADIHRLLLSRAPAGDADVSAHLEACPPCAALTDAGGTLAARLGPPPTVALDRLSRSMTARLDRERGPLAWLRSRPTPLRIALAVGLLVLLSTATGLLMTRPDLSLYPAGRLALVIAALAGVGAAATWATLRPLYRRLVRNSDWVWWLGLGLGIPIVLAALPQAHALHPASLAGAGSDFAVRAARCFMFGMLVGSPVLLFAAALSRNPGMRAPLFLAAALAGVAGNLVLQLDCPITHPEHLLAGHATVGLGFVALTATTWAVLRRARSSPTP